MKSGFEEKWPLIRKVLEKKYGKLNNKQIAIKAPDYYYTSIDKLNEILTGEPSVKNDKLRSIEEIAFYRGEAIGRECTVCKQFKTWDKFYADLRSKTGCRPHCIECKKSRYV